MSERDERIHREYICEYCGTGFKTRLGRAWHMPVHNTPRIRQFDVPIDENSKLRAKLILAERTIAKQQAVITAARNYIAAWERVENNALSWEMSAEDYNKDVMTLREAQKTWHALSALDNKENK